MTLLNLPDEIIELIIQSTADELALLPYRLVSRLFNGLVLRLAFADFCPRTQNKFRALVQVCQHPRHLGGPPRISRSAFPSDSKVIGITPEEVITSRPDDAAQEHSHIMFVRSGDAGDHSRAFAKLKNLCVYAVLDETSRMVHATSPAAESRCDRGQGGGRQWYCRMDEGASVHLIDCQDEDRAPRKCANGRLLLFTAHPTLSGRPDCFRRVGGNIATPLIGGHTTTTAPMNPIGAIVLLFESQTVVRADTDRWINRMVHPVPSIASTVPLHVAYRSSSRLPHYA